MRFTTNFVDTFLSTLIRCTLVVVVVYVGVFSLFLSLPPSHSSSLLVSWRELLFHIRKYLSFSFDGKSEILLWIFSLSLSSCVFPLSLPSILRMLTEVHGRALVVHVLFSLHHLDFEQICQEKNIFGAKRLSVKNNPREKCERETIILNPSWKYFSTLFSFISVVSFLWSDQRAKDGTLLISSILFQGLTCIMSDNCVVIEPAALLVNHLRTVCSSSSSSLGISFETSASW